MDVHLNTLSDWAVQSLCETFFVPRLSSLGDIPALPLRSVAEILLGDPTCSVCLPSPIANRIIDGLARRGKLTEGVLNILLDRNRIRLTALPLYCIDVDPNAFVDKIAELVNVTSIDISFSSCWADLSTPFLKIVEDKCMTSLTSFCARHVVGEIGLVELPNFSNLQHLDIGFTSVSREELRTFVSSLPLLEHLCISGIPVSLLEVFSTADCLACVGLRHLGLNSLKFVSDKESEFTPALRSKISEFFTKLGYLSSVDLSYVSWCGDRHNKGEASVKQALYEILMCSSSLTHLDSTDTLSLDCVCDVLRVTNRFGQLKFLENFNGLRDLTKYGAENCQISTGANVDDYRSKHALRNYASLYNAVNPCYHMLFFRRDEVIPAPVLSMIYAGLLRLQTEKDDWHKVANATGAFLGDLMDTHPRLRKGKQLFVLSHSACSLLEFAFQHFLNPRICPLLRDYCNYGGRWGRLEESFLFALLSFSSLVCPHPRLLHLAMAILSNLPEKLCMKYKFLGKVFEKLPAITREHLAINQSYLSKLVVRLSKALYCDVERLRYDSFDKSHFKFALQAYTTIRALCSLCHGLPNLFHYFVDVPEAVDNLAEVALRISYFYFHCNDLNKIRVEDVYCAAVECLSYIAEIGVLAHVVCSRKVIKVMVNASSSSPTERMRFASSYLAGLLVVNDELDSIWPRDVEAKDALVAKVFGSSDYEKGFFERTNRHCYYYTTLVPLVKVCNCSEFPAVSAFGWKHLAYFCNRFNAREYFDQTGLCPLCLLRKEVGADVLSRLSIPAELKDLFDAVMKACPVHKED